MHEGGPPRRYGMSIGVLQANDLGGTSQDFVCLRLLMCALGRHRSVGPLRARTGTYCSGSGGFCVTKTLTSKGPVRQPGQAAQPHHSRQGHEVPSCADMTGDNAPLDVVSTIPRHHDHYGHYHNDHNGHDECDDHDDCTSHLVVNFHFLHFWRRRDHHILNCT
jgi:hypothetical protein